MAFCRFARLTSQNQAFQGSGFRLHCSIKTSFFFRNALRAPLQSLPHQKFWPNKISCCLALISSFFVNSERTLSAYFQFAQMDLAHASLVLIRVLRTLSDSIAKNLHKLKICLRFYSLPQKTRHSGY